VRFVVDAVALGQVFLRVLRFFSDSIIPLILHAHLYLHAALSRTRHGRSLAVFQKVKFFWKLGLNRKVLSLLGFKNLKNLQIIHKLSVHLLINVLRSSLFQLKQPVQELQLLLHTKNTSGLNSVQKPAITVGVS
jgi:hypothetical protein